ISAVGALYRPGPMGADSHNKYARRKNGREPIDPIHPELEKPLEKVLGETYGLIVYQEQVMEIAQVLAGFTLGQADNLRRAMGKKKKSELDKQFAGFEGGMLERGFSPAAI
ncbi:MAG: polymerase subunit alpha, partial [Nocardioidaceae bacterium]|nr:polymerase subunit alpha [Nocardioidaceae bacterium]